MPGMFNVQLPGFQLGKGVDFSILNEGLDALGKSIEKNKLLAEQREIGQALRSGGSATSSSAPQYGGQVTNKLLSEPADGAAAASGRPSSDVEGWKRSVASIESAHAKNPYGALGPTVQSGDRAYGKYQVMGANVGPWTKEILGREMSPQEFLASPEAQEKVFEGKFGQYVQKTGDPSAAASMWFTGRPSAPNAQARDINGRPLGITGQQYVDKFRAGIGGQTTNALLPQAPTPVSAPSGLNYNAGMEAALRQGNLGVAMELSNAQRQLENTAYDRSRQARLDQRQEGIDAQSAEARDIQIQQGRQELEQVAQVKLAAVAQRVAEMPEEQARAMWPKVLAVNPRIASTLQQYGVDPNDYKAGTSLIIAEARGLSPSKATVHEVNGRLVQSQPDGTFKEVYQAPPKAKNLTVQEQKEVFEADEGVQAASNVIGALNKAIDLNDKAYSGPAAQTRGYIASQFGSEGGTATEELQNVVLQQVLDNLKATFGAAPTEGERQILVDIQGSVSKAPEVRRRVFENAIAAANRRMEFNRTKASAIRGGEYFQPGYQPSAASSTQASQPQPSGQQAAPVRIDTPEQYQALPVGAQYIAPDGSVRTKQ